MIGKRPIFLIATSILLICCVWCALIEKDYDSFLAARFISGLGLGALMKLLYCPLLKIYTSFVELLGILIVYQRLS